MTVHPRLRLAAMLAGFTGFTALGVWWAAPDRAVLSDFGISRVEAPGQTGLTNTGAVMGTPGYMPPEQYAGPEVTAAALLDDVLSLRAMALARSGPTS